jgi:hypothetical protein
MKVNEIDAYFESSGIPSDSLDDILEHHGVLGQKWGTRRAKKPMSKTAAKMGLEKAVMKDAKTQRRVATGTAFVVSNILANSIAKKANLNKKFVISATILGTATVNSMMKVHGATRIVDLKG